MQIARQAAAHESGGGFDRERPLRMPLQEKEAYDFSIGQNRGSGHPPPTPS